MTSSEQTPKRPRVFISYAQFSDAHSARILALAQTLRHHGVETELDQYHKNELIDWPRWCQEQLSPDRSDWVLMICSAEYRDRLENRVDPHTGKGVFREGILIDNELYAEKGNRRVVPVLLDDESEDSIPGIMHGWNFFRIRGLNLQDSGYADLYRLLTGQPDVGKATPGPIVVLPPRPVAADGSPATDGESIPSREQELKYLDRLLTEIEEKARLYAPLRGLAEIKPAGYAEALLAPWRDDEDIALLLHQPRSRQAAGEAQPREYDDILTAFGEVKQAALLGAPGSGKSTTLRKLAADLARNAQADPQAPLPVFVSFGDWRGDEALTELLTERIPEIGWAALTFSEAGRLVLLLDGLNEVPTAKRKTKAEDVRAFKGKLTNDTPFIVSCRRDDYVGDLDLGLDTLSLEPLSPRRIREVLHHWLPDEAEGVEPGSAERLFWQLAGDERLAGVLANLLAARWTEDDFWSSDHIRIVQGGIDLGKMAAISREEYLLWRRHFPNPRSLLHLAANPFMLTMLYQVWVYEGELPRNRSDLFARFIKRLLSREGLLVKHRDTGVWQRTPDGERLVFGLTAIAWIMQGERRKRGEQQAGDFGVLTVLPRAIVLKELDGETMLKKAEDATLLEGDEQIRFRHQLLQEYFTACAMRTHIEDILPMRAAELWPVDRWWERSGWEESALLLAGLYADDCTPIVRWLRDAQPEVAAQCILESGAGIADRDALFKELHDAWLPRLTDLKHDSEPEARAAVGRAVGRLSLDDRKGVGLTAKGLPDIDWIHIPGGYFIYQERVSHRIDAFWIARYPVTNAQFRAFLDTEDGYANERWWQGLENPDRNPVQPRWDTPNHPREMVSWFEAMAFCAWLSSGLELDIRVPTEWQWERAVWGIDGRAYPWGNDYRVAHANIQETWGDAGPHNLYQTTAVGIYPQSASPEDVLDLTGNVWEWCLNEYARPDRIQRGGGGFRVLRGGSWHYGQGSARADSRDFIQRPRARSGDIGFRVVCAFPIP